MTALANAFGTCIALVSLTIICAMILGLKRYLEDRAEEREWKDG